MAELQRRLGTADAVVLGLGSMLGAGVFVAVAPAAAAAGDALLIGLAVAALVAICNGMASAQLAAQYPTSGGTYAFARERLGPGWGFAAGWTFVVGKTASCAAMALTFAAHVAPAPWVRPVAVGAVVAVTTVAYYGVTRTAHVTRWLLAAVLVVLAVVVVVGSTGEHRPVRAAGDAQDPGVAEVLQAAGLLFFAFAGYARITTLGEEVRDPRRTIPRAVLLSLLVAVGIYAAVAATVLVVLGPGGAAVTQVPLAATVQVAGYPALAPVVNGGAALASLGALLALMTGVARTGFAMARGGDLPSRLAAVHPRTHVPHRAVAAVGGVVLVLVLATDLRGAIAFSSVGVLGYYLVTNLAAATQRGPWRRTPRVLQVIGATGCAVLALTLPVAAGLTAAGLLGVGFVYRRIAASRSAATGG